MGLAAVSPGELATIVTTLEMRAKHALQPILDGNLRLVEWDRPSAARYRTLFERVGAPWLWFSRLAMSEARLLEIIHDPDVAIFAAVDRAGREVGMLELDHRAPNEVELSYVGLVPALTGQGHGRWLMGEALTKAWRPGVERVWVHTCTLDHPSALGFYRASGFVAVKRTIETFRDPRLDGLLPRDAAPQIPLIDS